MFSRALRLCLVVGAIAGLGLLVLGKPFIKAWAGADLVPSSVLVAGTAAWIIVCSIYAPVSAVLSNEMFLKQYLGIYGAAAILAFLLKVAFACLFGISGVMWGMVLGYGALSLYAVSMVHRCLRPRGTEPSFANLPLRTFLCGVRDRAKTQARTQGSQC
jgi:O-antigen/teichoic acid export membrane protein